MYDWNEAVRSLNVGLPDDIARLKAAGYYQEAIARIDRLLAEDWTKTQNQPVQPAGPLPENPTPHGVDAMRDALLAQREILRRLRDTRLCFLARQTHNILLRALLRLTLLLNARNNTFKGHAKLRK